MEHVHKPAFPENESSDHRPVFGSLPGRPTTKLSSDYSPVSGSLPARLTTKLLQRLGFTVRDGSTYSRTRRTCTEGLFARQRCGNLMRPRRFRPGSRPRRGAVVLAGPLAPVSAHWAADARVGHYFRSSAIFGFLRLSLIRRARDCRPRT